MTSNRGRIWRIALPAIALIILLLVALGFAKGSHARPMGVTLVRGPYLQSVTPQGVTVVWDTQDPGHSQVDYGETITYGLAITDSAVTSHHVLTLTGLSPYTINHYRISTDGDPLDADHTFRTAAVPGQTTPFSFVAFGDTRTGTSPHQQVVDRIEQLAPALVLHVGDMVNNGLSQADWATFFTVEQRLMAQTPFYGVLGNHEQNSPLYFLAFQLPGNGRWYSFDYGTVHFIGLQVDSDTSNAAYAPGSPQYTWLEQDLAATQQHWKVVFFHGPPFSSGYHGSSSLVQAALDPLFARYGVDLVFNGHDHDYERSVDKGIPYIVTGGGGAPLNGIGHTNPASVYFSETYEAVEVSVTASRLAVTAVKPDGTRFDSFTLNKPLPVVYVPITTR